MKNNIYKIQKIFLDNKIYLSVLIISIITLIIGCLAVGFIRAFLIIILIDSCFIISEYINTKKKKTDNITTNDINQ